LAFELVDLLSGVGEILLRRRELLLSLVEQIPQGLG
jgi:hypothetical protein